MSDRPAIWIQRFSFLLFFGPRYFFYFGNVVINDLIAHLKTNQIRVI